MPGEEQLAFDIGAVGASAPDVLAMAAHELRTPLTSVLGFAGTLRAHGDRLTPEQLDHGLAIIERQAGRLRDLVDELLDVSLLQTGVASPRLAAVDVAALLTELVADLQPLVLDGRSLTLELPAPLDPARADASHLRRAVTNLITNGLRYTPPGGHVAVAAHAAGDAVAVEVHDDGPGIGDADQRRIFGRYERAARSRCARRGAGLGLYVVHRLVTAMGATVAVESAVGQGSCFRIVLPAVRRDTARHLTLAPDPA